MSDILTHLFLSPEAERYIEEHSTAEPELLVKLRRETHLKSHMPQMLSGPVQGRLLSMISHMLKPQQILEIGTFTGYSAICLAEGLDNNGILHTIEINPEWIEIAASYFSAAGLDAKVKQHPGAAKEIIPLLPGPFDLVFLDADKDHYSLYFDLIFDKLRPGGWILADNTLWYGRVLMPDADKDRETAGIMEFNRKMKNHPDVDCLLLPHRDGLSLIRKKSR